ncbi:hypothetical protein [Absidia glauca]|uniref:Uncharacterized protein n=1 Tax=Absidia glauca TaxID=4829 RepID=A0A168T888_ABSGL|nr:hypothetical protein [Absidia glauca]
MRRASTALQLRHYSLLHSLPTSFYSPKRGSSPPTNSTPTGTNSTPIIGVEKQVSDYICLCHRLENHGVFQIGTKILRKQDVPDALYNLLPLDNPPSEFPMASFVAYLNSILFTETYGTPTAAAAIFAGTHVDEYNSAQTYFIMRILFIMSENVHCRLQEPRLRDSETSYCAFALWPMLNVTCNSLHGIQCGFRVGETHLDATESLVSSAGGYLADGKMFLKQSGLELLLLETSGPLGTRDKPRHVKDHIKGAYGCFAMLMAILKKYPYADKELMKDLRVLFIHSGATSNHLRLWVMKPRLDGNVVTFERMMKTSITTDSDDGQTTLQVIRFFWKVKGMLERSVAAINELRKSNNLNLMMRMNDMERSLLLPSYLKPKPVRHIVLDFLYNEKHSFIILKATFIWLIRQRGKGKDETTNKWDPFCTGPYVQEHRRFGSNFHPFLALGCTPIPL